MDETARELRARASADQFQAAIDDFIDLMLQDATDFQISTRGKRLAMEMLLALHMSAALERNADKLGS